MDERGVSMPIQYVLLVAIVAILASTLLVSAGGFVSTQQDSAVRHGMDVAGTRLVADLVAADRLAGSMDDDGTMELAVDTPTRVAGTEYLISIESTATPGRSVVRIESVSSAEVVTVEVVTDLEIQPTTVDGGRLVIVADPGNETLEVRDA